MTKKVWITGASSGIGKATAIKFAKEGWQVAASARRENLLEDLNKNYQNIHSFPLDVVNSDRVKEVFNDMSFVTFIFFLVLTFSLSYITVQSFTNLLQV